MICLKPSSWLASQKVDKNVQLHGRSPYGERGLKLGVTVYAVVFGVSLFLRRAWIEMSLGSSYLTASLCRSPYGEHGLKSTGAGARRRSGVFLQVGIHSIGTIFQQHRQLVSNRNCDVGIRHPFLPSYLVMRACSLR